MMMTVIGGADGPTSVFLSSGSFPVIAVIIAAVIIAAVLLVRKKKTK